MKQIERIPYLEALFFPSLFTPFLPETFAYSWVFKFVQFLSLSCSTYSNVVADSNHS
jgi:hypothetical protein